MFMTLDMDVENIHGHGPGHGYGHGKRHVNGRIEANILKQIKPK
jgi:hypothetical protein